MPKINDKREHKQREYSESMLNRFNLINEKIAEDCETRAKTLDVSTKTPEEQAAYKASLMEKHKDKLYSLDNISDLEYEALKYIDEFVTKKETKYLENHDQELLAQISEGMHKESLALEANFITNNTFLMELNSEFRNSNQGINDEHYWDKKIGEITDNNAKEIYGEGNKRIGMKDYEKFADTKVKAELDMTKLKAIEDILKKHAEYFAPTEGVDYNNGDIERTTNLGGYQEKFNNLLNDKNNVTMNADGTFEYSDKAKALLKETRDVFKEFADLKLPMDTAVGNQSNNRSAALPMEFKQDYFKTLGVVGIGMLNGVAKHLGMTPTEVAKQMIASPKAQSELSRDVMAMIIEEKSKLPEMGLAKLIEAPATAMGLLQGAISAGGRVMSGIEGVVAATATTLEGKNAIHGMQGFANCTVESCLNSKKLMELNNVNKLVTNMIQLKEPMDVAKLMLNGQEKKLPKATSADISKNADLIRKNIPKDLGKAEANNIERSIANGLTLLRNEKVGIIKYLTHPIETYRISKAINQEKQVSMDIINGKIPPRNAEKKPAREKVQVMEKSKTLAVSPDIKGKEKVKVVEKGLE